jgi:hypothetical protein
MPARRAHNSPFCAPQRTEAEVTPAMQNGGSARVLVNPPVSLNVMLE